jgi:SHS2 domain-containing protein
LQGPRFEFVPHTADIAARLTAPDLGGLFEAAADAFTEALTDRATVRSAEARDIRIEAPELDLLLVEWLEELLYLFETDGLLVATAHAQVTQREKTCTIEASVFGERRDPARHPLKLLVKAVTYHGLQIERVNESYVATVIFDI